VKPRSSSCKRYHRLSNESFDRRLSAAERLFMDGHLAECQACAVYEQAGVSAFSALRSVAIAPESSVQFEERVMRRLKVSKSRESFRYWSPAFLGAGVAGVAMYAALQLISSPNGLPGFRPANEKAILMPEQEVSSRRDHSPLLLLDPKSRLNLDSKPVSARRN
jgi:hypothetical protein